MYDGSPGDTYDATPLFGLEDGDGQSWPSLFAEFDNSYSPANLSTEKEMSSFESLIGLGNERHDGSAPSSTADMQPETVSHRRLSITSGVTKNQRTKKDLPPIEVDSKDAKALKRAKNTMAARKSRQKKRDVEETLRHELNLMTKQRDRWMHVAIAHGAPVPNDGETPVSGPG